MNVRVVGMTVACALAALATPLRAEPLLATPVSAMAIGVSPPGGAVFGALGGAEAAESMLRRQPAPVTPRVTPRLRRLRKGTLSLGGQVGFGIVRGSSELNDHFDSGLGYAFRFRYMLSSRSALGFSFESQRYGTRAGLPFNPDPFATDSELVVTTVASEMVLFFNRERETTPYLVGGLGFASPNVTYDRKESRRVDEGPFLVVGAGLERFVRQRMSLDFSLRGYAQVGNSELSMFSQLTAGIHLYPGD
jgi:hypothetical protein